MNALAIAAILALLGSNVSAQIAGERRPEVLTSDVGAVWTWRDKGDVNVTKRLTTTGDGTIAMIDVLARGTRPGPAIDVPTHTNARLTFGGSLGRDADAIFGDPEFEGAGPFPDGGGQASFRGYRLGEREAVLLFDARGGPLRELFYGKRTTLARAGLIPHAAPADVFKAATLARLGTADFVSTKEGVAYVRISVNADGSVGGATIFVSSGDDDLDRIALVIARGSAFVPATRNGAPVASTYFRREDFVQTGD